MPSLTDVFVAILPDTTQFGRQLTAQLRRIDAGSDGKRVGEGFSSGFSGAFKGIAAGLAGAFAAVGVGAAIKDTIGAASDLGESVNAVNVVFGEAAGGVLALGNNAAKSVGLSKTEFNGLAVQFSNFASTVAGSGGDVTGVLGDLTGRAADFASVMNLDVSEAAAVFQSALSGETEPIKKFGIDLSAAAVEAFALANGIGTAGKQLTESEKVQARYALLMQETAKTTGDFANTSDSLANRQRILGATFDNIKASIGAGFLPIMEKAFGFVLDFAIPAVTVLVESLRGGEVTTVGFLGRIGDFGNAVREGFGAVKAAVTVFVEALRGGEVTTLGFLSRVGDAGYIARDIFDTVKGGVLALIEAFRSGGEQVTRSGFAGGMQQIGIFARDAFDYIKSDVIPAALAVGRTLREIGQGALPIAVAAFKSLFSAMTGIFNFVKANDTVFSSLAAGLVAGYVAFKVFTVATNVFKAAQVAAMVVTTAYKAVLQAYALWTYTATGSTTAFAFAMNVLKVAFLTNPIGIVVIGLVALGAALFVAYKKSETFRDAVNRAWATIKGSVGSVVDWFTGTVLPALQGVWRGISSKAMELRDTLATAWRGISAGFGAVLAAFGAVYDKVIAPVFAAFKTDAKLLWTGLQLAWDGIRVGFSAAMTGFRAVYQTLIAPVFVLFRVAAEALQDAVVVVWEGIRAGFDLSMRGIQAVYRGAMVPIFDAYRAAALVLWRAAEAAWEGIRAAFDLSMKAVRAVYDSVIGPLFKAFRVAADVLWDGVKVIFAGMRTSFDVSMQAIRAVYNAVIVPLFNAYRSAAQSLWSGLQVIFNAMRSSFDSAMRGMRSVYDGVVRPLFDTFANGVRGLAGIFSAAVGAIGAVWGTLRDKMRSPIKIAFDWVNANVIGKMRSVISAITGGSVNLPDLPHLAKGGPVKGPGGPTEDRVPIMASAGEYVVNAAAVKKFRPLLETLNKGTIRNESTVSAFSSVKRTSLSESVSRVRDDGSVVISAETAKKHHKLLDGINAGRPPTRLPGDEFGGPGDVWETVKGGVAAIKGFAADMIAKGARKAAEALLNPLRDRLLSIIGSGNVVSAVLRGGVEKLFAAVMAKGDEKDKEMAAAKKAGTVGGGGISAYPGGGSQANLVAFGRLMQSMGARASEHPLFGGVNPVHTRNSNHYVGKAIDLNYGPGGQNATEMAFFDKVVAQGMPRRYGLRYIWRAKGHFNHMHVDYDKGGYLQPGAMGVNRGTRPERILTAAQTDSFDRLVKVLEGNRAPGGTASFNFNVYNPIAEPTSVTTNKALQRAADLALV